MVKKIELVISRFNENIDWVCNSCYTNDNKTIYNKGRSDLSSAVLAVSGIREVVLPNVGREGHSFLYHIVHNYDNLADVTIFLPGSCMDEIKCFKSLDVISRVRSTNNTVIEGMYHDDIRRNLSSFSIDKWVGLSAENKAAQPSGSCAPSRYRPFGKWFDHFFGRIVVNVACFTSTFAVSREHILQRSKRSYEELLESVSGHSNPEDGHFLERCWQAVFHPVPEECLVTARPMPPVQTAPVAPSQLLTGRTMADLLGQYSAKVTTSVDNSPAIVGSSAVDAGNWSGMERGRERYREQDRGEDGSRYEGEQNTNMSKSNRQERSRSRDTGRERSRDRGRERSRDRGRDRERDPER